MSFTIGNRKVDKRFLVASIPKIVLLIYALANYAIVVLGGSDHFPTVDEARMISAGVSHWSSEFRAVNDVPPLARMVATLPILAWSSQVGPFDDFRFAQGEAETRNADATLIDKEKITYVNARRMRAALGLVRLSGVLWWSAGVWLIYRWASELYGEGAGWFGLILWGFGPNILAREQMATPELPAAVACLAATYHFRRWLHSPSWGRAALAGILLGIAQLTEFTALTLLLVWPILGAVHWWVRDGGDVAVGTKGRLGQAALGIALSITIINLGYGFAGTGHALGDIRFASRALTSSRSARGGDGEVVDNRFRGAWLGKVVIPLPADYLEGIARRLHEPSDSGSSGSRAGQVTDPRAVSPALLLAKVPIGTCGLLLWAVVWTLIRPPGRGLMAEELALWLPIAITLTLALSPVGFLFSVPGVLLLSAPFAIIGMSKLARFLRPGSWKLGWLALALLVCSVASSLASVPHSLYYINEVAGRFCPAVDRGCHVRAADCGQDLFALKDWLARHPEVWPVGFACHHVLDPLAYGIDSTTPPLASWPEAADAPWFTPRVGPYPGYYALDLYNLSLNKYDYFKKFNPVFRAGASIFVYHLTSEDVDRLRRSVGLTTEQDVRSLKDWLEGHPEASPLGFIGNSTASSVDLGVPFTEPPRNPGPLLAKASWYTPRVGPYPGYYAVDPFDLSNESFAYFKNFEPICRVGDSLLVYHIGLKEAGAVRLEMGLPALLPPPAGRGRALEHGFLRRVYENSQGVSFNYAVFVPSDYTGDRPCPLILFLHGYGERRGTNKDHLAYTLPAAIKRRADSFGFIVVCPEGYSGAWLADGEDTRAAMKILAEIEQEYNVNRERVYLSGVSSGALGVWTLASRYPDRWAAIVPVATPSADPALAPAIAKIPCWCFHNSQDVSSPPTIPRRMIAALREAGGSPRYTEFLELTSDQQRGDPLGAHNAWDKAYNMPELYHWMIQQSRPEAPSPTN